MSEQPPTTKQSFWTTLPGLLTAAGAFITSIAVLIGALNGLGLFATGSPRLPTDVSVSPSSSGLSGNLGDRIPSESDGVSGRWDHPAGGFIVFQRASPLVPEYTYQEYEAGGSTAGDGEATFDGKSLRLQGFNFVAGEYDAVLTMKEGSLEGMLKDQSGREVSFILKRN